jgi:hypothetical protein
MAIRDQQILQQLEDDEGLAGKNLASGRFFRRRHGPRAGLRRPSCCPMKRAYLRLTTRPTLRSAEPAFSLASIKHSTSVLALLAISAGAVGDL